jgi:membrane protein implicated in regulation of membrane protease activity
MAAKLVLALLALTAIVVATVFAAYRYFDNRHRRSHEKELKQMEHTEKMVDVTEDDTGVERELEDE